MATIKDVQVRMEQVQAERRDDTRLADMQRFYKDMRLLGIAVKQQYNLPPISTSNVASPVRRCFMVRTCETE